MTEIPPLPLEKDHSVGLVIFGILTVLGGLFSGGLMLLLVGAGVSMASCEAEGFPVSTWIPAMTVYGGLAVGLIWLGVGSILKRRWARALLLMGAWIGLISGAFACIGMLLALPSILHSIPNNQLPTTVKWGIVLVPLLFLFVVMIVLPGIWIFFYGSRHVKATCEYADPVERWTDRHPLPLIAAVLILWGMGFFGLVMAVFGPTVILFFGQFLGGMSARIIQAGISAIWIYAGLRFYRLDGRAWWVLVAVLSVLLVSALLTYALRDFSEMYSFMGYSDSQLAVLQQQPVISRWVFFWGALLGSIPMFGYLIYLRRYFTGR